MMNFNPMAFVDNLKYMGVGMLGVFIIIGIIIGATYAISALSNKKSGQ
ncbi:MAG: hypothetical protein IJY71_03755 [Clostridia bacterium]|nr:hypothetical protein [Clostridia bacterium]